MAYLANSDLNITVSSQKQGKFYIMCVSSIVDIRQMKWILGDRSPLRTSTLIMDQVMSMPIYIVRLVYDERYYVKLQLRDQIVQQPYIGNDLVLYLMTDATYFGFFEEQEAMFREQENRRVMAEIMLLSAFVVGGMIFIYAQDK